MEETAKGEEGEDRGEKEAWREAAKRMSEAYRNDDGSPPMVGDEEDTQNAERYYELHSARAQGEGRAGSRRGRPRQVSDELARPADREHQRTARGDCERPKALKAFHNRQCRDGRLREREREREREQRGEDETKDFKRSVLQIRVRQSARLRRCTGAQLLRRRGGYTVYLRLDT